MDLLGEGRAMGSAILIFLLVSLGGRGRRGRRVPKPTITPWLSASSASRPTGRPVSGVDKEGSVVRTGREKGGM